jgi:hypothetical protein
MKACGVRHGEYVCDRPTEHQGQHRAYVVEQGFYVAVFWEPARTGLDSEELVTDYVREKFNAVRDTANALIEANEGLKRMADAALQAHEEHTHDRKDRESLRDQLLRLEQMLQELLRKQQGGTAS